MNKKKAFTLVELMLALSIIVALSSGVFFIYKIVNQKQKVNESIDSIIDIKKNMQVLSAFETSSSNAIKTLLEGNNFPLQMKKGEMLLNAWHGKMEIN